MRHQAVAGLVEKITLVKSQEACDELLAQMISSDRPVVLSFVNAHALNLCYKMPGFIDALRSSDIILRDGAGMKMLYKSLGINEGLNMNGTDLIPVILDRCAGKRIAIFGTEEPYLSNAVRTLESQGRNIVAVANGFEQDEHYVQLVLDKKPGVIVLAMGMPKQEKLSIYLRENLDEACLIINGGAIVDFIGGKVTRAPLWMRKLGAEWVYRLANEPKRLFNRYIVGNIVFLRRVSSLKRVVSVVK